MDMKITRKRNDKHHAAIIENLHGIKHPMPCYEYHGNFFENRLFSTTDIIISKKIQTLLSLYFITLIIKALTLLYKKEITHG